ncbi:MAG: exonuclease SbcCD subunit D [Candidatus Accumulibacter sp.]|jgi:exonuclease SbcD|nr:exonuclease SbcCD subunit D [Accumulibacter sp.]
MKLFHTADWHLGQTLVGFERLPEQRAFLDWLRKTIAARQPDALVVAGDIFDTPNPSAEAQKALYQFLAAATAANPTLQIVLTAGNHDSGNRLEAPDPVLENFNIRIVGSLPRDAVGWFLPEKIVVPLRDAAGEVRVLCLAIPFLRAGDLPPAAPGEPFSHVAGTREIYARALEAAQRLRDEKYPDAAIVAIGHCHVSGAGETDEAEHTVLIGGEDALPTDIFPPSIAYAALGHIHRAQAFADGRVRYCGSPLPLSFSEIHCQHRILEVTFPVAAAEPAAVSVENIPVPLHAELQRVPAANSPALPLDALLAALAAIPFDPALPEERQPFLEVRVREDAPDPARGERIRAALDGRPVRLVRIRSEPPPPAANASAASAPVFNDADDLAALDPRQLFANAYRARYQTDPSAELFARFSEILTQITNAPAP